MAASTVTVSGLPDRPAEPGSGLFLVLVGPGVTTIHPLPEAGQVMLGRSEDATIRVPDPSASRNHARLIVGEVLEVEDLGSANGTFVRDVRIQAGERTRVVPGDVIAIGATVLSIQSRAPSYTSSCFISHSHFEARLIEECARAEGLEMQFALLRIDLDRGADLDGAKSLLAPLLRPGDVAAPYGPTNLEILLLDSDRSAAERLAGRIALELGGLGKPVAIGTAYYPADGRSPGELFSRACERVRLAPEGEGSLASGVVIRNKALQRVYDTAAQAARGNINVLITGETGSGKEVLARTVHTSSPRVAGPFVSVNCAAITESLLESELFGYEKGAFTGAAGAKKGLVEAASGGTLFLDEVGEMPLLMQAKLLRLLETREVLRVGSTTPRLVDVRFVAATNRDLEEEVAARRFREDLFFRLAGITLAIPPLRERTEEIEPLCRLVLETVARQLGRSAPTISADALDLLLRYPWPGNVRELRNVMERAVLLCRGSTITREDLPEEKMRRSAEPHLRAPGAPHALEVRAVAPIVGGAAVATDWKTRVAELERAAILDALGRCSGNRSRAAEFLGMPRTTLLGKMREYGISPAAP